MQLLDIASTRDKTPYRILKGPVGIFSAVPIFISYAWNVFEKKKHTHIFVMSLQININNSRFSTKIFYMYTGVPSFTIECPCAFWRELTTCFLYVVPRFGNLLLINSGSVYLFDIAEMSLHCFCFCSYNYIYRNIRIILYFHLLWFHV